MLQISQSMMDKFEAEAAHRAVCWHQERLLARFPSLSTTPAAQRYEFAHRNRLSAIRLGISDEEDIATFLDCAVMYGEDFSGEPWASDILDLEELSGADRAQLLREAIADIGVTL